MPPHVIVNFPTAEATACVLAYADSAIVPTAVEAPVFPGAHVVVPLDGQRNVTVVSVTLLTTNTPLYAISVAAPEMPEMTTTLPGEKARPHTPHVTGKVPPSPPTTAPRAVVGKDTRETDPAAPAPPGTDADTQRGHSTTTSAPDDDVTTHTPL